MTRFWLQAPEEPAEGSEASLKQLGLGRHQQHQFYQMQRQEQEQQQKHQEQQRLQEEQQQQQQQTEASDQDAERPSKRSLLRFVSRVRQKNGTACHSGAEEATEPHTSVQQSATQEGKVRDVTPEKQADNDQGIPIGSQVHNGEPMCGSEISILSDQGANVGVQQQLQGLTAAAEQIRIACLQLQRQLQEQQQQHR